MQGSVSEVPPSEERQTSKSFGVFVTLRNLVEAGLLKSGPGVLLASWKGLQWTGDLLSDGNIQADGQTFTAPTQFALAMIQKEAPNRKSSNGWEMVSYEGR
jgi:hypothetical protein